MLFGMFTSCIEKQQKIKSLFASCASAEEKYAKIIELGRKLPPLREEFCKEENLVSGCQSRMYLHAFAKNNALFFEAQSDALISAGLAALLIDVYSGETPETILKCAPDYLEEIGIYASLTPSRSNGLYSLHLRMKQEALKAILLEARSSGNNPPQ